MIKYYTSRELSQKLGINLAKWKRWSREFLPPDPLGGMQSGYARQYSTDEAFKVHLGGHLVANLHLTVPGARKILTDLNSWLIDNEFFGLTANSRDLKTGLQAIIRQFIIFIRPENNLGFSYVVRGLISTEPVEYKGHRIMEERFVETPFPSQKPIAALFEEENIKVLNITTLFNNFIRKLDLASSLNQES